MAVALVVVGIHPSVVAATAASGPAARPPAPTTSGPTVAVATVPAPSPAASQLRAAADTLTPLAPVCSGTGSDGPRVQAVYAYTGTPPTDAALDVIRGDASDADQVFVDSAARTGGTRRVRWATDSGGPGCRITILTLHISTAGAADFTGLRADLTSQGLTDVTRKYLVWTEGQLDTPQTSGCGLGEFWQDDSPDPASNWNATNGSGTSPTFAAFDQRCWGMNGGHSVPSHELMHMLGAVQSTAPHANGDGHCTDDYDAMCYGATTQVVPGCTSFSTDERLFDCNNDDYFNTDPLVGTYTCLHWNTAFNPYLYGSTDRQPPRAVASVTATGGPGSLSVSWPASPSCIPPDGYRLDVTGPGGPVSSTTVPATTTSTVLGAPAGAVTVTVTPTRGGVDGPSASADTTVLSGSATTTTTTTSTTTTTTPAVSSPTTTLPPAPPPDRAPVGELLITKVDRRSFGLLGDALDPDTTAPIQVLVVVEGVGSALVTADYDLPGLAGRYPGYGTRHGFLYLRADLPAGDRNVCAYALGANGGANSFIGCRRISVK